MKGDIELASLVLALAILLSSLILGVAGIIAAGRIRKGLPHA